MINYQKNWFNISIEEKIAFREKVMAAVRELYSHMNVRSAEAGDVDHFLIENKENTVRITAPLRDVYYRFMISAKTTDDLKTTIIEEFGAVINKTDDPEELAKEPEFAWIDIKDLVRLQLLRIENIPAYTIDLPFGGEVAAAFIIDKRDEELSYFIKPAMLDSWNMTQDELYPVAMANLSSLASGFEIVGTHTPRKEMWNEDGAPFSSTSLLLPSMRELLAQNVGLPFRFGIPSIFRFYAWADIADEKYQIEMKAKMERELKRLPHPLSDMIFEVDEKGQISVVKPQPVVPPVPLTSNN